MKRNDAQWGAEKRRASQSAAHNEKRRFAKPFKKRGGASQSAATKRRITTRRRDNVRHPFALIFQKTDSFRVYRIFAIRSSSALFALNSSSTNVAIRWYRSPIRRCRSSRASAESMTTSRSEEALWDATRRASRAPSAFSCSTLVPSTSRTYLRRERYAQTWYETRAKCI